MLSISTTDLWSILTVVIGAIMIINDAYLLKTQKFQARFSDIAYFFLGIYIVSLYTVAVFTDLFIIKTGVLGRIAVNAFMLVHIIESRRARK